METLDQFDGAAWRRSSYTPREYEPGGDIGDTQHAYRGTTVEILQVVEIEALRGPIAPTAGVPLEIYARDDISRAIRPQSFDVFADSALVYAPELFEGDRYQVLSSYPLTDADLGALATGADGELTPIFANASEEGAFSLEAAESVATPQTPPDLDFYTELPEDRPSALRGQALLRTDGASTDFERAWMLESWFQSGDFVYETDVSTGHSALNLADWLSNPDSPNYRTGYCEQFAAAMAVLGRELEIPSRVVWGFTPGTVTTQVQDDVEVDVIQVRGTNAHAWVEMWLEPVGWVKFDPTPRGGFADPTAAFDPTEFVPEDEANSSESQNDAIPLPDEGFNFLDEEPTEFAQVERVDWWLIVIPLVVLLASTVPLFKRLRRRRRLARIRNGGDITAAWDEIVDRLADLGRPVSPSSTPMEVAEHTNPALAPIAATYSAAIYGGREGAAKESDLMAVEIWLHERFDMADRVKASLSPRSLFRR
jgi:transglutaminase-like putative cysteine protease